MGAAVLVLVLGCADPPSHSDSSACDPGTRTEGVFVALYDGAVLQWITTLDPLKARAIVGDTQGGVVVAAGQDLVRFDAAGTETQRLSLDVPVDALANSGDRIIAASNGGNAVGYRAYDATLATLWGPRFAQPANADGQRIHLGAGPDGTAAIVAAVDRSTSGSLTKVDSEGAVIFAVQWPGMAVTEGADFVDLAAPAILADGSVALTVERRHEGGVDTWLEVFSPEGVASWAVEHADASIGGVVALGDLAVLAVGNAEESRLVAYELDGTIAWEASVAASGRFGRCGERFIVDRTTFTMTEAGEVRASARVPIDESLLAHRIDTTPDASDVFTTHVVCTPDGTVAVTGSFSGETPASGNCVTSG